MCVFYLCLPGDLLKSWNSLTSETFVWTVHLKKRGTWWLKGMFLYGCSVLSLQQQFLHKFAFVKMKIKANMFVVLGSISLSLNIILYICAFGHTYCKFLNIVWNWKSEYAWSLIVCHKLIETQHQARDRNKIITRLRNQS